MRTKLYWLALCLVALAFCGDAIAANNALPKITVSKDGRGFVTAKGKVFVPFGVTYYRPDTGWAPQVWKQFDAEKTRKDFALMHQQGVNCARVFLSYQSFYPRPGALDAEGLRKFDEFLAIAEAAGIYVHPTGPDFWEGAPAGQSGLIEDAESVAALEEFWKLFAARYRGRAVIFGYDLRNEPAVSWDNGILRKRWSDWVVKKYGAPNELAAAWGNTNWSWPTNVAIPSNKDALKDRQLLDYQDFRESLADEWTARQAAAIKSVDPDALVSVGMVQWSVPVLLPGLRYYAAFRPERQAKFLDFMEIHFYPLDGGAFDYRNEADETRNLAYLESVVRAVARPDKPTVLSEFGWYGGGKPKFDGGKHPAATEEQQANYCRRVVETSAGYVCGWLNWGFFDEPQANDCSELTGLATSDGKIKAWGKTFQELARRYRNKRFSAPTAGSRPVLDWEACVTSAKAAGEFREKYAEEFNHE